MAEPLPPDPQLEEKSSDDEDFDPTKVNEDEEELSSSDSETEATVNGKPKKAAPKKKRKQGDVDGELDSGDEATIQELKKRKKRKADDEDSGGEGGLIKTRAQRRNEKEEKKQATRVGDGDVTVDVDALWANLSSRPIGRRASTPPPPAPEVAQADGEGDATAPTNGALPPNAKDDSKVTAPASIQADDDDMITIKRVYDFAGERYTESKRVHKNSAEAKLYLASKDSKSSADTSADTPEEPTDGHPTLRRPLKRPSLYEPNPTGEVKGLPAHRQRLRTPSRADVLTMAKRAEEEEAKRQKATKLNTVQKSAIDWAAHVDQEGFQEELDVYGRSKQGFLGKMDFLSAVEGRREEEGRKVRMMG